MSFDLRGKRVIVTGAAGGFGSETMRRLQAAGAVVVGLDLHEGTDILACDIRDRERVNAAVAEAVQRLGGLDVLVNNAGIGTPHPVEIGLGEPEQAVIDVNLLGTWHVTSAALPHLLASPGARVVNIASMLAVVTLPYLSSYIATKRGVAALSDSLRIEHGDRIKVSTVYPGYVKTAIHTPGEERSGLSLNGWVPEESVDQVVSTIMGCIRRPRRDRATSFGGNVALKVGRAWPSLIDRGVRRQLKRRGGMTFREGAYDLPATPAAGEAPAGRDESAPADAVGGRR